MADSEPPASRPGEDEDGPVDDFEHGTEPVGNSSPAAESHTQRNNSESEEPPAAAQQAVGRRVGWRRVPGLRRFRSTGAAVTAIVGLVTAIFGAYVGYQTLPKPITLADWQRQVISICEQSGADLRAPLRDLTETVQNVAALIDSEQLRAAAADLTTTARDLQDSADSYKLYIGRARALDRPDDRRVDDFLNAGAAFYGGLETIASDLFESSSLVSAIPTDGSGAEPTGIALASLETVIQGVDDWQTEANLEYEKSVLALDLERCPGWNETGKPAPIPTSEPPATPAGNLDPTQQALARTVGISPDECQTIGAPIDSRGATAQLNCNSDGLTRDPAILGFDSLASLRTWFNVQPANPADCGSGASAEFPIPAEWDERGRIKCTPLETGQFRVDVMLPDRLVGIGAEAEGPSLVEQWTRDFVLSLD